jgi:hypothetical protein
VSLVLQTDRGMSKDIRDFPLLQQAGVRYRWGGEAIYGILERSYPRHKMAGN